MDAIRAGRITNPTVTPGLACVPHVITVLKFDHGGAIDITFPIRVAVGPQHDLWLAPTDAVAALDQRDGSLRPPGEPHAIGIGFLEQCHVEACPELATKNGTAFVLGPAR